MKSLTDTYTLLNGVPIPCLALGTFESAPADAEKSVAQAIEYGYRHIDTAAVYKNEKSVGSGIKKSGVKRSEIFITSKLWNTEQGYESTLAAFDKTVNDLALDYLDLYLIHWPAVNLHKNKWQEYTLETWRAFEKLYNDKKIRAIGVSNFLPHHLQPLMEKATIKPMVNQIEYHPGYTQDEAVKYSKDNGIIVEAWGPLGRGEIFKSTEMAEIAKKYDKTIAQICLRWCLQQGTLPLPKSVHLERIKENAQVFDFEVSPKDMQLIDNIKCANSGLHPDKVAF